MVSQLCWAGAAEQAAGEVTYPQRAPGYATESCDPLAPPAALQQYPPAAHHILTRHTSVPSLQHFPNMLQTGCSQTSVTLFKLFLFWIALHPSLLSGWLLACLCPSEISDSGETWQRVRSGGVGREMRRFSLLPLTPKLSPVRSAGREASTGTALIWESNKVELFARYNGAKIAAEKWTIEHNYCEPLNSPDWWNPLQTSAIYSSAPVHSSDRQTKEKWPLTWMSLFYRTSQHSQNKS